MRSLIYQLGKRMGVGYKMVLVALTFSLPIGLLTFLVLSKINTEIKFTNLEKMGIAYQRPVERLLINLQEYQMGILLGSKDFARAELETKIENEFQNLQLIDKQFGEELLFTKEGLRKYQRDEASFSNLKGKWESIIAKQGSPNDVKLKIDGMIEIIRSMLVHVSNTSNLILDPNLDSYYLMSLISLDLPPAQMALAEAMTFAAEAFRKPTLTLKIKQQFAYHALLLEERGIDRTVQSGHAALDTDVQFLGISPALQNNLPVYLERYRKSLTHFIKLNSSLSTPNSAKVSLKEYLVAGRATRLEGFELWNATAMELDRLLDIRIARVQRDKLFSMILSLLALLVACLISFRVAQTSAKTEMELSNSEKTLRTIINIMPDALVQINFRGMIVDWNVQAESTFGWSKEEALGQMFHELIISDQFVSEFIKRIQFFLKTGQGKELSIWREMKALHKNEDEFPVELAMTPIKINDFFEFTIIVRDLSERKQTENEILYLNKSLMDFQNAIQDSFVVSRTDKDGIITYANDNFAKISGYSVSELVGQNHRIVSSGYHSDEFWAEMWKAISSGKTWRAEIRNKAKNGSFYWMDIFIMTIFDELGKVKEYLSIRSDISEKKQAEFEIIATNRELEQAKNLAIEKANQLSLVSKYKTEFLANMSHELRTPLNSLLILSETLAMNKDHHLTEQQVQYAQTIHSSGQELLILINDLLDLAKVEAGKMTVLPQDISLHSVCQYLERGFRPLAIKKNIAFTIVMDEQLKMKRMHTDANRLQQILNNLLANAFKFTHHGSVTLTLKVAPKNTLKVDGLNNSEEVVVFSVADTGIGIANEKLDLIFQSFQQSDGTISRNYGGTGLGLTISRELSKLLGGTIDVDSRLGVGSTFTVYIPCRCPVLKVREIVPPQTEVSSQYSIDRNALERFQPSSWINLEDKKILLFDDDIRNAFAMTVVFENEKMHVIHARDGLTGMQILKDNPDVNLVIMDIMMPGISGLELIRQLRRTADWKSIPIVALAAKAMPGDREECLLAGANEYILKPVHIPTLLKRLSHFLETTTREMEHH